MNADLDPSQNPYRPPAAVDPVGGSVPPGQRKRSGDMALVGLFLGASYGAATGAAITLSLGMVQASALLAEGPVPLSVSGQLSMWITYYVAVAALGAVLGALNGAVLGPLQGLLTARKPPASLPRLRRFAAFCWAGVAAVWCLLIDQSALSSAPQTWMLYLTLLVAPSAAGLGGALTASRLARTAWGWHDQGDEHDTSEVRPP